MIPLLAQVLMPETEPQPDLCLFKSNDLDRNKATAYPHPSPLAYAYGVCNTPLLAQILVLHNQNNKTIHLEYHNFFIP